MILRWWFRAAFWFRRGWRVPVEAMQPWLGDARPVERRLLIARIALRLAEDLRVYPPDVAADILREAAHLIRVEHSDVDPLDRTSGLVVTAETQGHQQSSLIMHVWWALVALGVTAGLLAAFTVARADERRIDPYDAASRRVGYVVVDGRSGRIDVYDVASRRLDYGTVNRGSHLDSGALYDVGGQRLAPTSIFLSREARR